MSRIGKLPVTIPQDVTYDLCENKLEIKGKTSSLTLKLDSQVIVSDEDGADNKKQIVVKPANDSKLSRSMWGTVRSHIQNMVTGVTEGFSHILEINGVGYRVSTNGKVITLALGYSHDIIYAIPANIDIKCVKNTIIISGANKQKVGQIAGELKKLRPVEPYKGKGIRTQGQYVRRKEGKKK